MQQHLALVHQCLQFPGIHSRGHEGVQTSSGDIINRSGIDHNRGLKLKQPGALGGRMKLHAIFPEMVIEQADDPAAIESGRVDGREKKTVTIDMQVYRESACPLPPDVVRMEVGEQRTSRNICLAGIDPETASQQLLISDWHFPEHFAPGNNMVE